MSRTGFVVGQVPRKWTLRCTCRKFTEARPQGEGGRTGLREKLNSGQSRRGLSLESQVALQMPQIKSVWPCIPTVTSH